MTGYRYSAITSTQNNTKMHSYSTGSWGTVSITLAYGKMIKKNNVLGLRKIIMG